MPLYLTEKTAHSVWGVWKVEETLEECLAALPNKQIHQEALRTFTSEHRKIEYAAVRLLLYTLLNEDRLVLYHQNGAPYFEIPKTSLSISHTRGYVAVVVGDGQAVAIDIEQYASRVRNVVSRFMRSEELLSLSDGNDLYALLLHWSAKESLYKAMGQSGVDFKEHLRIFPFPVKPRGEFTAQEYHTSLSQHYDIQYLLDADFVLTWIT